MATPQKHPCLLTNPERLRETRKLEHPLQRQMFEDLMVIEPERSTKRLPAENPVMPGLGNPSVLHAIRYLLTNEKDFARKALALIEEFMEAPSSGTGSFDYDALGMIYTSIVYDCLFGYLEEKENRTIHERILDQARISMEIIHEDADRQKANCNNHYTRRLLALAEASWAFRGELEGANRWLERGLRKLDLVLAGSPADGSDPYGGTWLSTHPLHPLFAAEFHAENGEDRFESSTYLQGLARFRWYAGLGEGDHSLTLTANSHAWRNLNDSMEFYLLARRYRDPYAQWMGNRVRELSRDPERIESVRPFYEFYELDPAISLLAFDPSIEARDPAGHYEPSFHFRDSGWAILRDDWRPRGPVTALRCTRPGGRHRTAECDPDFWHEQPGANALFLYLDGEYLINGSGPVTEKNTALCNTLTVGGKGQIPVDRVPPPEAADIEEFVTACGFDLVRGEAGGIYPEELGVTRFSRTVLFIKPGWIVIHDEVDLKKPSRLEFRFHSRGNWLGIEEQETRYIVESGSVKTLVDILPSGTPCRIGPTFCRSGYSSFCDPIEHLEIRLEGQAGRNSLTTVLTLLDRAAPGRGPQVYGTQEAVVIESPHGRETILFSTPQSRAASTKNAGTDARVAIVSQDASGVLKRLFLRDATFVRVDGKIRFECPEELALLALDMDEDSLHLKIESPKEQVIRLQAPELERRDLPAENEMLSIPVRAGRLELHEPFREKRKTDIRHPLSEPAAITPASGTLYVRTETDLTGRELLLVSPPENGSQSHSEVIRAGSFSDGKLEIRSPIFQNPSHYSEAKGAYLTENLIADGDMTDPDYWHPWKSAPLVIRDIVHPEAEEEESYLRLVSGHQSGFVYQLVSGLEKSISYRLSCRYQLVRGNARLEYHDPRNPDVLTLPKDLLENIHGKDPISHLAGECLLETGRGSRVRTFPGFPRQIATVDFRFQSPDRPGPWRGGHRNRPEFLAAFRLEPETELHIFRITMGRR